MNDNDNEYHYITQGNTILYANPKCIINPEPTDTPYLKGTITSINNNFNTITIDNLPNNIPFAKTLPIYNAATINTNDMQTIPNLTEVDLLNNLSNRLTVSKTSFTYVGNTLLIVNPYHKDDSIYTNAQIEKYIQLHTTNPPAIRVQHEEPHLYDVVLTAIENLLNKNNKHNQAIIISGESGAGKTETAKNCMECIAYYFDRKGNNYETLAQQIIACNPILEAFGNAKTIRNDNSSRFGKYVTINVDTNMNVIKGASIKTYLLEKTRITRLNADERNFHFFYQLLNCGDTTLLTSLYLVNDVMCYKYLNCSNEVTLTTINDKEQFQRTMQCFHTLNFTQDEINTVLKLVAAVLLIGNITFTSHDDNNNNIQISSNCDNVVSNVCELLSCDENEFKRTLTTKVRVSANSTTETPLTVDNANTFRDSFAKELYIRLFKWIVTKMNNKLNTYNSDNSVDNSDDIKYIGLLDIFGFECYKMNSLEQLCINYTNEQLHQLYIKDYFEEEVNEFKREGLNDQVSLLSYTNNQSIIELIDKYPNGLFLLLDNATMLNKNEDYLLNEIRNQHNKHKAIKIPKVIKDNKLTITVNHTAKDVVYDITHFIPKNNEQVEHTMTTLITHSSNEIIKKIYFNALTLQQLQNEIQSITNNQQAMRNESKYLSGKFRQDIHALINELKQCECSYIRCIIPNNDKKPFTVYPYMLYKQIQYLGILDTIRVRNEGYSNRWTYQLFNDEYQMVFNNNVNVNTTTMNHKDVTHMIIKQLIPNENEYEMNEMPLVLFGNSKLYMKNCFYNLLQRRKEEMLQHKIKAAKLIYMSVIYLHKKQKVKQLHTHINKIQTHFRLLQHRNTYTSVINKVSLIQNAFHSHMLYHIFKRRIKNILLIQSVFHTQCERLSMQHKQFLMKFIQLRIAMYSNVLHDIRRQKTKNVVKDLLNHVTNVIVDNEYAKIWKKVSPFFKRVIATKKHIDVVKCKKNYKIGTVMNMFIVKHLLYKVSIKKNASLQLRQHSLTKLTFNYYLKMWEVSLTIQNYIKRYLHMESARNKIITKCLNEKESNINDITNTINDIYKVIFPSTNNNNNSTNTKHHLNKSSSVSNITNNNSISINKYSMQRCGSSVVIKAQPTYNNNNNNNNMNKQQQQSNSSITAMQKHSMQYNLPHINAYSLGKIKFFARILSIDIYLNINTIYDNEWHCEFSSIYNSNITSNTPIQQIHLGENHTLLINSKGKVFTWGWNNNSQCCNENVPYIDNMILPCFNGKGNVCGYNGDMPLIYYSKGNVIKHEMNFINNVSCGDEYSFIVDEGGNMYGFGCNENGEICKCNECKVDKPWLIGSVLKGKVKDVKTTKQFTIVITKEGECYYWLHKSNNNINVIYGSLCKIEFNNYKTEITQIACGYNFAMLLTKSGIIYAMGNNKNNILGLSYNNNNNNDFIYEPQHVSTITDKIIQIKCGFKHTVCISSIGKVYTWGNNTYGQLGLGSSKIENVSLPINVTSLSKTLSNTKIVNVDAGFKSTVMLSDNHCIYYTGVLDRDNSSMSVVKFDVSSKSSEIADESSYIPMKVYCTWNKHMSVFYTVVADVREIKLEGISEKKINAALGMLSMKWCYDTVLCPYVESIAGYFSSGQMRKEGK